MRAGEPGAFDTFCEFHFRLAKKSSRILHHWFGMEDEDAFQIACIGLVQAARRFEPERGNQFSTLASIWIRQSCQRYGLVASNLIRIPVHAFWPLYRLQFTHREILASYGMPQARYQFKRYVRQQGIRWVDWLTFERTREIRHFSSLFKDEVDSILERRDSIRDPLDSLLLEEDANLVHEAISTLSSRKQEIIRLRYGMGCEEHTLEAVAQIFGLTRERIRQIQAWSEKKLKFLLTSTQDLIKENSLMTDAVPIESAIQEEEQITAVSSDFDDFSAPMSRSVIEIPLTVDHDLELQLNEPRVTHPMTTWIFAPISKASVRRDPNETELFKTEQAAEGEYAGTDALVREVIQNSLDASSGNGPVRVRFSLHSKDEMPERGRLAHYFSRLAPALEFREIEFGSAGIPKLPNGFLVCEDFGTVGLAGNPNLVTDPPKNSRSREDFYWFWRNIGRSGKTGDDLGRWGLGKTVYRAASRVGCMFGLTIRQSDGKRLLMGQSVLKIHWHEEKEYAPEGFWCEGASADGTPQAISDESQLDLFANEWKLTRRNEPGLSVVVPYVADELRTDSILRLVVVNFFLPILEGKLVVEVAGSLGLGQHRAYRLDETTIDAVCSELKWNGRVTLKLSSAPPLAFARDCLKRKREAIVSELIGVSRIPTLNESSFTTDSLDQLQRKFVAEEMVGTCIRASLPKKNGESEIGELLAFIQRTPSTERFESYYVREGMTITKLNTKRSARGVRGLVIVEPGPLASLLGDTEGPSHITWDTSNDERPNRVWKTWKGRVTFFSNILDSLLQLLSPQSKAADFELLSDFFSISQLAAPQLGRRKKENGESTEPPPFTPPPPTPRWFRLNGKPGGFVIADSKSPPTEVGSVLQVAVAYDLPTGNPLKGWSKFDFDFKRKDGDVRFSGSGVKVKAKSGNVIEVEVLEADFNVEAKGFDIHRDLFVRIDELKNGAEDTDS